MHVGGFITRILKVVTVPWPKRHPSFVLGRNNVDRRKWPRWKPYAGPYNRCSAVRSALLGTASASISASIFLLRSKNYIIKGYPHLAQKTLRAPVAHHPSRITRHLSSPCETPSAFDVQTVVCLNGLSHPCTTQPYLLSIRSMPPVPVISFCDL